MIINKNNVKKLCLLLIPALTIINDVWAQEKNAIISFDKKKHNFGTIDLQKKSTAIVIFHFENKGNIPLFVHKVTSSCGCTVSEWTKSPVAPGKKDK